MKKIVFILLCTLMISMNVSANNNSVTLMVDGINVNSEGKSFISNTGRIMVPLRILSENLSANVIWHPDTQTVSIDLNDKHLKLKINDTTFTLNGEIREMDSPAIIIEGKTYVPIRHVTEALGAIIEWNSETRTVSVFLNTSNFKEKIVVFPDPMFNDLIREMINKPTGDVYESELLQITSIYALEYEIKSIEGIEYIKNLKSVYLNANTITDISRLNSLDNLEDIVLMGQSEEQ